MPRIQKFLLAAGNVKGVASTKATSRRGTLFTAAWGGFENGNINDGDFNVEGLYAWAAAVPDGACIPLPPAVRLILTFPLFKTFEQGGLLSCPVPYRPTPRG